MAVYRYIRKYYFGMRTFKFLLLFLCCFLFLHNISSTELLNNNEQQTTISDTADKQIERGIQPTCMQNCKYCYYDTQCWRVALSIGTVILGTAASIVVTQFIKNQPAMIGTIFGISAISVGSIIGICTAGREKWDKSTDCDKSAQHTYSQDEFSFFIPSDIEQDNIKIRNIALDVEFNMSPSQQMLASNEQDDISSTLLTADNKSQTTKDLNLQEKRVPGDSQSAQASSSDYDIENKYQIISNFGEENQDVHITMPMNSTLPDKKYFYNTSNEEPSNNNDYVSQNNPSDQGAEVYENNVEETNIMPINEEEEIYYEYSDYISEEILQNTHTDEPSNNTDYVSQNNPSDQDVEVYGNNVEETNIMPINEEEERYYEYSDYISEEFLQNTHTDELSNNNDYVSPNNPSDQGAEVYENNAETVDDNLLYLKTKFTENSKEDSEFCDNFYELKNNKNNDVLPILAESNTPLTQTPKQNSTNNLAIETLFLLSSTEDE